MNNFKSAIRTNACGIASFLQYRLITNKIQLLEKIHLRQCLYCTIDIHLGRIVAAHSIYC